MAERGSTSMYLRSQRQSIRTLVGLFTLLLLILPTTLLAQNMGQILGRITDSTGSVIVGAQVTGTMQGTGLVRTATTNDSGDYTLPALPIGTYTVSVEAQGFKKFANQNVTVEAEHNVHLDAMLSPGAVEEQVTVTADASQVDTTSPTMATTIPQQMVEELPLSGGNVIGLAATLPGVTNVTAPDVFTGDRSGPTLNASGGRSSSNLLLLDGLMHVSLFRGTGQNYPNKDALQEVQYLSGQYSAMYGHFNGSIMNVITKSGTNTLHGSLYEYAQNTAFNAADYATHVTTATHQNQFGGTVGGPIIKDRLFFMLSYDGIRKANASTSSGAFTPTTAQAGGDLSGFTLTNPAYSGNPNYDSLVKLLPAGCAEALGNGQYIIGSKIPTVCLNSVSQTIIKDYVPAPNGGPNGSLLQVYPNPAQADSGFGKLDYHFGKHTIDGRYFVLQSSQLGVNANSTNVASYEPTDQNAKNQMISINDTYIVSSDVVNVFRVGYNRFSFLQIPTDRTTLAAMGSNMQSVGPATLPNIHVNSYFDLGSSTTVDQWMVNQNFDFLDQVSYMRGKHSLQFGAELLRMQYLNRAWFYSNGNFDFESTYTGNALSDFLFGFLTKTTVESPQIEQSGIQPNYSFYFQDDWRALPRLTLNLGLRYELPIPWYQPQNWWGAFRPGQQSTVIPTAPVGLVYPGDAGVPRGMVPTPKLDFAPRFGFAYDVFGDGKTAIRGGYGIFYDAVDANIIQNNVQPFTYINQISGPLSLSNPLGTTVVPTTRNLTTPTFTGLQRVVYPAANLATPYVQGFNISVQQQLPSDIGLGIYYVGKLGRKQLLPYESNPAVYAPGSSASTDARRMYQGFGDNVEMATAGTSNYNALQVQVRKRKGRYLTLQAAYTWSRSLDDFSSNVTDTANAPDILDPNTGIFNPKTEYGPSSFNATHIASLAYTLHGPKFRGKSGLVQAVAGGWNLAGIFNIRSGQPLNVTIGTDRAMSGTNNQRPIVMGDWSLPSGRSTADEMAAWFNNFGNTSSLNKNCSLAGAAFCAPATGTFGNLTRDALVGPGNVTNNMSVFKQFKVREKTTMEFRCDAFGAFNTPNLSSPGVSPGKSFGVISSTSGARRLQLSLKLKF
jgi:hypothetical protein